MVGALMQSTSFSSTVFVESKIHSKQYGNTKRSVKMMCSLKSPPMRVRTFSGLRGVNALDNMVNKGQHLHSKVAAATSARKAKPSRIVPKAMSEQEMYEHFTEKAMEVITLAQKEACQLGQNVVSTEMILLGLIGEDTGIAAKVLKSMGINLEDARVEVDKIIGRANGSIVIENPFTACAERVLELSLKEARQLGHDYIGSEHLLLGLLREDEVVRACVFKYLGVDQNNIRTRVNITGKGSGIVAVEIPWTFRAKLGFGDAMLEGFTRGLNLSGHNYSRTDDIPFYLGRGRDGNALRVLENLGANPVNIRKEVIKMVDGSAEVVGTGFGGRSFGNNMLTPEEYDTNFTKLSDEGKLDPVIEWKPQIKRDTQIPVGVLTETKPETIEAKKVITLELRELEWRLKRLIKLSDEIILFIYEFRTLIGARAVEGDIDAA